MTFRPDIGFKHYINWTAPMNAPKSDLQLLFESIRHTIATKHQVPKHLTEVELKLILNLLKPVGERDVLLA